MSIERLKQEFDIAVRRLHFPLRPNTPPSGLLIDDLYVAGGMDPETMHARVATMMKLAGLAYRKRTHTYNTRLAQELSAFADTQPGCDGFHNALYRAYFAEGRNIGDLEVLVDIAQSSGISSSMARDVLTNRTHKEIVDADWDLSRQLGVQRLPTFIFGEQRLVGTQPYHALSNLLVAAEVRRR